MWFWIDYQLDMLCFAGCCLLSFAALRRLVHRCQGEHTAFRICGVLTIALIYCGELYVHKVDSEQRINLISHMSAFATTYAGETEKLRHADLPADVAADDPRYLKLIEAQRRWLSANSLVSDIYTIRRDADGQSLRLLIDSETDYDGDGKFTDSREQRTNPGESYSGFGSSDPDSCVNQAFAGQPSFISVPYSDRWGTWVSALHPLYDADRNVEAVLGVDFPAAVWGRQIFNARLSVIGIMAVIEVLLLGSAALFTMTRFHLKEQEIAARILQQFKTTLDQTLDSVFMFRPDTLKFIYVNEGGRRLLGYSEAELLSLTPMHIAPQLSYENFGSLTKPLIEGTHQLFTLETVHTHKDGHEIPVELSLQYVSQATETPQFVAIVRDITERKKIERELMIAARLDRLTGLPNRALFNDRLKQFIERTKKVPGYQFALMFLDFDRFKIVNDSLGHDVGDALLMEIAARLKDNLRTTDSISTLADGTTVSRLGGDEFVVILDDVQGPESACLAASRLINALNEQYQLGDHQVRSTASIGIVCSDSRYERAEDMVRDADTAMYEAKARGKACYVVFDDSMHEAAQRRLQTESDLRLAVGTSQICLVWQPIVGLEDGALAGAEALVRWNHPTRGIIAPDVFLPIAEETQIILPISDWVLREACRQLVEWKQQAPEKAPGYVSINLSRVQLMQTDLAARISAVLEEYCLQPEELQVELKESEIMRNRAGVSAILHALASARIRLAIDDFGTGYSSLACLQEFPFTALKMDRGFVANLSNGHDVIAVAHSVVTLAENLGIACVAEGIEDPVQLAVLQSMNCGFGQGYFLSPPGPPAEILKTPWKRQHSAAAELLGDSMDNFDDCEFAVEQAAWDPRAEAILESIKVAVTSDVPVVTGEPR
jgi:diguanylate cyclase (GGDEF)-like protein/PAS domain S-box-containing protein